MTEFISTCSMPLAVIFLIVGFFFLVKGADIFVEVRFPWQQSSGQ